MTDSLLAADIHIPSGTCVAIVAPDGYAPDEAAVRRGIALLEAQGCKVKNYYDHSARHQRFGATDTGARCAHPTSCRRCGSEDRHGPARRITACTALHLALLAQGGGGHLAVCGFAGPMLCGDFGTETPSALTMDSFWRAMTQPTQTIIVESAGNPTLHTSGTLWGGNLAMVVHLLGTPYFPHIDGGILFVEDINEHPYRVERMLLQLEYAGVLACQKAVLLGDFSNYRLSDYDNGYNFEKMLGYARQHLSVPLLAGLPFGHIPERVTLPLGAHADLQADAAGFTLSLNGYRTLSAPLTTA